MNNQPKPKVTPSKVAIIKAMQRGGSMTQTQIANVCGVSQSHVSRIVNGQRWRQIAG